MRDLHLIVVGKLNDKNIEDLENVYFKRLTSPKIYIYEARAHSEDRALEAKEVLTKIDDISKTENPYVVLMMEKGKQFTSVDFSNWLSGINERQSVVFVIGGASGHGEEVIKRAHFKLSLSELTYPHKLARLLLVEQIYRAQTIAAGHPYNK
ncbi:MAG: 23S rRNA (pseudouridine(1915)-N(3))-methyltransferase RlmH [Bacteriovorax sp.]|nr:23S rRNA (pseudouridine(1915)-N(3))-methyltransferase RlmH [Bacteriovorax sp.]